MTQMLIAILILSSILICGFRRIQLVLKGFIVQAISLALFCFGLGFTTGEIHYYLIGFLTIIAKAILIPYIVSKSSKELKIKRELFPIISPANSYIITVLATLITFSLLKNVNNPYLKCSFIVMTSGIILLIGRKSALNQMFGFLTLENGFVIFELSMIKMPILIEIAVILEVLIIALIMGIMIFHINRTFDSINTDYLSDLKE